MFFRMRCFLFFLFFFLVFSAFSLFCALRCALILLRKLETARRPQPYTTTTKLSDPTEITPAPIS